MRVRELAEWLEAPYEGFGALEISRGAPLDSAGPLDLSFVSNDQAARHAPQSKAGCLIVPLDYPNEEGRTIIRTKDPRAAFARAVNRLHPRPKPERGIHPSAVIAPSAEIGPGVGIGARATIGEGAAIGAGTSIGPGAIVGTRATIGQDCILYGNVTLYDEVTLGDRVILHSGCVIGADGFGFVKWHDRYEKFPQIGKVIIDNDVEIGANSCIDRAALGVTYIGEGTKIDNMVHVGHNCRIGRHVVVAAQTGFSGGVVVEDNAVIGGQVGVGDKARIEAGAVLGSGSGVLTSKIIRSGQVVWGTPARPLKEYLETLANLGRLPEIRRELRELREQIRELLEKTEHEPVE